MLSAATDREGNIVDVGENVPGTEILSHGIGYGDVDKDGINDVVVREGWFKGTADNKSGNWVFHPADLGEPCSHMQVLDVNSDGKNDVVSASASVDFPAPLGPMKLVIFSNFIE